MSPSRDANPPRTLPQPVLILCADEGLAAELVRELAGRSYQPLIGRPGWSWTAALDWARPAAAVVDPKHPAALSNGLLSDVDGQIGIVVFGERAPAASVRARVRAIMPTSDARLIGGAVDDALR